MGLIRISLISLLIVSTITFSSFCAQPADPQAVAAAGKILTWLESLPNRVDTRVVSGQLWGYAYEYQTGYQQDISALRDSTGKWPAMIGTDYAFSGTSFSAANNQLIQYWKAGGLITVGYHIPDPGAANMGDLINPSSSVYSKWILRLDSIALRLKNLSDSGAVVLWRPFHEMNGNWFWYGQKDTAQFKAVWRHMYTYFSQTKGLHNLLWVYAPDDGPGNVTNYYPGSAYVDITGLDNYNNNAASLHLPNYAPMVALNKPFGLTEFSPASSAEHTTISDSRILVEGGLKTSFPKICFFLFWNRQWGLCYNLNESLVMNDPWVITRDEVDWQNTFIINPAVCHQREQSPGAKTAVDLRGRMVPQWLNLPRLIKGKSSSYPVNQNGTYILSITNQ